METETDPGRGEGPRVIRSERSTGSAATLVDWIVRHRAYLDDELLSRGSLLFRGVSVDRPSDFRAVVEALAEPIDYIAGISPRRKLDDRVYESTYVAPQLRLAPHNEMCHLSNPPGLICFCCMTPSAEGGETPIADGRKLLQRLRPETRASFEGRKLRYTFTYPPPGKANESSQTNVANMKPWDEAFATRDRDVAQEHCERAGLSCRWNRDGSLTTFSVRDAFSLHPRTGERVWFNQILLRNGAALVELEPRVAQAIELWQQHFEKKFGYPAGDRSSCTYDDGSPIETAYVADIARATDSVEVAFQWQKGDILFVDNLAIAHGRRPFRGEREILCVLAARR
jgi:alpha-ketoglutarate-dependent taurine dioxygenase